MKIEFGKRPCILGSCVSPCISGGGAPRNVDALSEARFREKVEVGRVFRLAFNKAVRRKPPMVAADAALCKFNGGKVRCRGARELADKVK